MSTLREHSKKDWTGDPTLQGINAGSLQRIADATEVMAQRYNELIADRDRYKRWHAEEKWLRQSMERRLSAAKGQITKLKRAALKAKTP